MLNKVLGKYELHVNQLNDMSVDTNYCLILKYCIRSEDKTTKRLEESDYDNLIFGDNIKGNALKFSYGFNQ